MRRNVFVSSFLGVLPRNGGRSVWPSLPVGDDAMACLHRRTWGAIPLCPHLTDAWRKLFVSPLPVSGFSPGVVMHSDSLRQSEALFEEGEPA
jgi:hypothetical protein